ncbi:MAG: DUF6691 family protein [Betaproteobacteria bacterium]|jgi:uncharacterized membrane protein YedE/YeeE|nr:YeeE/YedE family protein [Rhodocyclaceae bacterium]MCA3134110.1 YeeE/YedE family protein [Rhodocyclaceae bacterium]MCA3142598.1 YeeE/YedE family protein [Rhodocyclaceae bacterium]MCA3144347.1 YeeE/YedE family protein [Rhodocyclaceae bacterium]MCE2897411.1 YeeE/YedE family protein [Betaproteobacteria bacterium]
MARILFAFGAGVVFAIGLLVAQMTNPAKVTGFLDITGRWDPTLAFVMGGALVVFGASWYLSRRPSARPVLEAAFQPPNAQVIDWRLVAGSLVFGVGWGLGGFCPGPALVSAGFGDARVWIFVGSMLAGMVGFNVATGRKG